MIRIGTVAKDYLEAGAMSSLIGLYGFIDEHTFLTKSGDLGVVIEVRGVDAECLDHPERDHIARRFESAIRTFDERFRIYQYLLKRDNATIPHRHYENPVVEQAISSRIEFLAGKTESLYTFDIFFVLMYEGWQQAAASSARLRAIFNCPQSTLRRMFSAKRTFAVFEDGLARACELLSNKAASFVIQLQDTLGVELLDKERAFQFFRQLVNFSPYKQESRLKYDLHLDYFACDSPLECHRDHLRLDDYYVQALSLKKRRLRRSPISFRRFRNFLRIASLRTSGSANRTWRRAGRSTRSAGIFTTPKPHSLTTSVTLRSTRRTC